MHVQELLQFHSAIYLAASLALSLSLSPLDRPPINRARIVDGSW